MKCKDFYHYLPLFELWGAIESLKLNRTTQAKLGCGSADDSILLDN